MSFFFCWKLEFVQLFFFHFALVEVVFGLQKIVRK